MSLVALRLEPLLGRVREVDRLEVESALRSDRLEDDLTLVGGNLAVRLVLDDEARDVLDDGADRLDVAVRVLENDADLGAGDAETPEALAVTVNEAGKSSLDLLKVETKTVEEVELAEGVTRMLACWLTFSASKRDLQRCGCRRQSDAGR